jgi:uncharacterized phage-associated protein
MPYSADAIANFFLDKATATNRPLTQMHVQKFAFYSHGWYLALDNSGHPLIGEPVEAWKWGPVFRSLYREFADFKNSPINRKARDIKAIPKPDGGFTISMWEPSLEIEQPDDVDRDLARAVLERVWEVYGGFTASQLSNMTHAEGEPWRIIRDQVPDLPKGLHIPNEMIRECFKKKLRPIPQTQLDEFRGQ